MIPVAAMRFRRLVLTAAVAACTVPAVAGANGLVVSRIEAAQVSVVAYLPSVRSFDVSEALRQMALKGRRVVVITSPDAARDPRSYLIRLAHVPGVETFLVEMKPGLPFLVVDGKVAWAGAGLSVQGGPVREVVPDSLNRWAGQVMQGKPARPLDVLKLRYSVTPAK